MLFDTQKASTEAQIVLIRNKTPFYESFCSLTARQQFKIGYTVNV